MFRFEELNDDDAVNFLDDAFQRPLWSIEFLALAVRGWILADELSATRVSKFLISMGVGEAAAILRVRNHIDALILQDKIKVFTNDMGQKMVLPRAALEALDDGPLRPIGQAETPSITKLLRWARSGHPTYQELLASFTELNARKGEWEKSPAGNWKEREAMMFRFIFYLADTHFRYLSDGSPKSPNTPAATKTAILGKIVNLLPLNRKSLGLPSDSTLSKWLTEAEAAAEKSLRFVKK